MINIFERRRYLIILVTILYFTGIFEQIFNNKNILDFLSSKTFVISTIIYIICVAFVVRLISSAKKIKKLSNKITSGNFINNLEEAKPREPYDKATYEIIDSFSKKISKEKSSVIELENIISSIKFGLMVIENKENRIIYINNEMKKIINVPDTKSCINKKYWEIIHSSSFSDAVDLANKKKSYVKSEISFGTDIDKIFVIRVGFIDNDKNKMLITLSDVTETKQLNKIKEELILNVSHELRTPLSGIIGAIEFINANIEKEDKTINKMIDIERNSNRLNNLTEDILNLSEIENNEKSNA